MDYELEGSGRDAEVDSEVAAGIVEAPIPLARTSTDFSACPCPRACDKCSACRYTSKHCSKSRRVHGAYCSIGLVLIGEIILVPLSLDSSAMCTIVREGKEVANSHANSSSSMSRVWAPLAGTASGMLNVSSKLHTRTYTYQCQPTTSMWSCWQLCCQREWCTSMAYVEPPFPAAFNYTTVDPDKLWENPYNAGCYHISEGEVPKLCFTHHLPPGTTNPQAEPRVANPFGSQVVTTEKNQEYIGNKAVSINLVPLLIRNNEEVFKAMAKVLVALGVVLAGAIVLYATWLRVYHTVKTRTLTGTAPKVSRWTGYMFTGAMISVLTVIPYITWALFSFYGKYRAIHIGVALSCGITILVLVLWARDLLKHLTNYRDPQRQRRICRITFLVPLYAVDACLSLWRATLAPHGQTRTDLSVVLFAGVVREFYEAFCVFNFMCYLVESLEHEAIKANNLAHDERPHWTHSDSGENLWDDHTMSHESRPPSIFDEDNAVPVPGIASDSIAAQLNPLEPEAEPNVDDQVGEMVDVDSAGTVNSFSDPLNTPGPGRARARTLDHRMRTDGKSQTAVDELVNKMLEHAFDNDPSHFTCPPPFCNATKWRGGRFVTLCRSGVLQYVVVQIVHSVMVIVLENLEVYGEGDLGPGCMTRGYIYLLVLMNVSQYVAIHCLIYFYHATQYMLAPIRPLPKFISIKLIVFATFWQGLILNFLSSHDMLPLRSFWDAWAGDDAIEGANDAERGLIVSLTLQHLLLCMEMFVAVIVHRSVFSYKDYKDNKDTHGGLVQAKMPFKKAFCHVIRLTDVRAEIKEFVKQTSLQGATAAAVGLAGLPRNIIDGTKDMTRTITKPLHEALTSRGSVASENAETSFHELEFSSMRFSQSELAPLDPDTELVR